MDFDSMQINAFALEATGAAAQALATPCTLTLQLPAAAQACSPGERPLGSVVKIEVGGKPLADGARPPRALYAAPQALLTLTF